MFSVESKKLFLDAQEPLYQAGHLGDNVKISSSQWLG